MPGQQTFACGQLWTDPAYNAWIGGRSLTTFYHEILERKYQLPMDGGNIYGHCALRLRCCYERSRHSLTRAVTLSERIHRYKILGRGEGQHKLNGNVGKPRESLKVS